MLGATNAITDACTNTSANTGKWPCGLHDVCMDSHHCMLSNMRRWNTAVDA